MTKIYVVEDNKTESLLLKLALSGISNIEIEQFPNGQSLLDAMNVATPNIFIADLNLPDLDGKEVIKEAFKKAPNLEVIVVSAQADVYKIGELQEMGIYNYVVKSESCLKYMKKVIDDLVLFIETKHQND